MSDLSFKVATRRTDPVTFDLEGSERKYSYTPQKQAAMVLPMLGADDDMEAAKAAFAWLEDGLSADDAAHILGRLKDPKDDLDFDAIEDIVTGLVEFIAARPTM